MAELSSTPWTRIPRCREDSDGNIWFATDSGLKRYDGTHWTDFSVDDGLHGAPINVICAARDGKVYAGSRRGISVFEQGKWRRVFPLDANVDWTIWSIWEAEDGTIWSGTARGALSILPDGELCYFTTEDCAVGLRVIAPWMDYLIVPDEYVTSAPWPEGSGVKRALGLPAHGGNITSAVVRALAPGGPGERAGIKVGDRLLGPDGEQDRPVELEGELGTSVTFKVQQLGSDEVRDITLHRDRVEGSFRDFWIFDVYEDQHGFIWFAVRTGDLIRFNNSKQSPVYQRYVTRDYRKKRPGTKLAETADGGLWSVTALDEGGLNRFDGKAWTTTRLSDIGGSDENQSTTVDGQGTLWVGGNSTLHAYRSGRWDVYRAPDAPIPEGKVIVYADRRDGLWVGGIGRGISRLDLGSDHFTTYQSLSYQFQAEDGRLWYLSSEGVAVSKKDGAWSTRAGLLPDAVRLAPWTGSRVLAIHTNAAGGMLSELVNGFWRSVKPIPELIRPESITVLDGDTLWFGSESSAYRYAGTSLDAYRLGSGLHAIEKTKDGTIWAAAGTNLYQFDGDRFRKYRGRKT